ncbi:hypothetical protein [Pedobacter sp. MW01-1-1]|uniref:hypothetical protein n=1 Tax=Pedobacter sp. MW01-1-1 TaxID=3383027 RepID=UPI003FF05AFE
MKKLIFTLFAAAAFAVSANAQIQKGNVMFGTEISSMNFGLDSPNSFRFNLSPKAAWFINDGVAIGGEVDFGVYTPGKNLGTTVNYGISALGRYYGTKAATDVVKNSRFFAEATAGISGLNVSNGDSTNGLGFSFGPGFSYFVTPSLGLEALVKYNGVLGFGNSAYGHNLSFGFGFQIYLPGKSTMKKVAKDVN